jgi:hypothetical protein
MSAVKDQSQHGTFLYTNFYNLYQKSKLDSHAKNELATGVLLKSRMHTAMPESVEARVISEEQQQDLKKWTTLSMRSNYRTLNESRKKLKYLLNELEEILAKS